MGQHLMFNSDSRDSDGFLSTIIRRLESAAMKEGNVSNRCDVVVVGIRILPLSLFVFIFVGVGVGLYVFWDLRIEREREREREDSYTWKKDKRC